MALTYIVVAALVVADAESDLARLVRATREILSRRLTQQPREGTGTAIEKEGTS